MKEAAPLVVFVVIAVAATVLAVTGRVSGAEALALMGAMAVPSPFKLGGKVGS